MRPAPHLPPAVRGEAEIERLIRKNEGLVTYALQSFLTPDRDHEEILDIGRIGLWKAARTFDESRGFRFSTYAVPVIRGEVLLWLRDHRAFGGLKVSRHIPTDHLPEVIYLDKPQGEGGGDHSHLGVMPCFDRQSEDRIDLENALAMLEPLEAAVIRSRYVDDETQDHIAERLGTHQMRVSRIERRALKKLRAILEGERREAG